MTNNICTDIDLQGPIKFLGATVLSFNSSVGWGSTSSTLSVDLIEDCENGDCFQIKNDCGGVGVGQPAYFKAESFEFNGIIQSYSANKSSSGLIYKVQLTDPRDLLQNATIITDTYQGLPEQDFKNFFNVYSFLEKEQCFDTNTGLGFGAGRVSAQGMSVRTLLNGLSSMVPLIWSPTGQSFTINFSTFPGFDSPEWYRIPGPSITILELLQNICDTFGLDFYVYLTSDNVIEIGTVDLKIIPDPNSIENWLLSQQGQATDISIGEELRNDITRTIMFGEKQHNHRTSSRFIPFFGMDKDQPVIPYHYEDNGNGFWILKDVESIGIPQLSGKQQIGELDIRFSMSGFKSWYNWVFFHKAPGSLNDSLRSIYPQAVANNNFVQIIEALQAAQQVNNIDPAQGANRAHRGQDNFTQARSNANKQQEIVELEIVCSWLSSLGNTYYGKQYLAELDVAVCAIIKGESFGVEFGELKLSAEPTNAGAWIEPGNPGPLGIQPDQVLYFKNDDSRVSGFSKYNPSNAWSTSISVEKLSEEDYTVGPDDQGNIGLFIKFDVDEKSFILNNLLGSAVRPHILIKFANMVVQNLDPSEVDFPRELLWQYVLNHKNYEYPLTPNGSNLSPDILHSKTIPFLKSGVFNQIALSKGSWGTSSLNDRGFFPASANPIGCAIAMKSNIKIYGPWGSQNFSVDDPGICPVSSQAGGLYGGIEVISDPEMAPWNFGSTALMNSVGCELVGTSNIGLVKAESGSATFPGLPTLARLGSAIITNGPSLTAVNTSFGSSGITTSYEFKTFTPKFGKLSKLFIERIKQQGKKRLENLKFIRSQMVELNRLNKKISDIGVSRLNNNLGSDARRASPGSILTSSTYDWYNLGAANAKSQVTDVGIENAAAAINEMRYDYEKKAFVSLEAIFGPVSVSGDASLPQYINISPLDEISRFHKSSPVYAQPPFYKKEEEEENQNHDLYNLDIKNLYLNPLSNPNTIPHSESSNHKGHSIDVVGRGGDIPEKGLMSSFYERDDNAKYSDDYRFLGLRGPIVLHSWGYDVDGKPIPNAADKDDDAKKGQFTKEKLKDQFLTDWLQKSKTWPVGPIDLRFDRNRGVWVSPQPHKIIVAKLTEDLAEFSSAKAKIINNYNNKEYGGKLYDDEGEEIKAGEDDSEAYINVVDRVGKTFKEDSLVYVYYDTYLSEYIILSGESSDGTIVRFKLIEPCDAITPTYGDGDEWVEYAGYGDKRYGEDQAPDSYAVRINCQGQPIKKDGTPLSDNELSNIADYGEHLIIVKDSVGEWGPSFNSIKDITKWKERAACGYGVIISDPKPSGIEESSSSEEEPQCLTSLSCEITYTNEDDETVKVDKIYEILYLESYARIIYGELTQDLYCSEDKANTEYSEDEWKIDNPKGNASITVDKFFGNADNGKKPIYLDRTEEEIEVRVFDPFFDPDRVDDSPFAELVKGSRVIAIFNETLKKYEIIQSDQKFSNNIRFKLIDICDNAPPYKAAPNEDNDPWLAYAGFLDKFVNSHCLGVRIDCDGMPIDKFGDPIGDQDIDDAKNDPDRAKEVFVKLLDTVGQHGPAFAMYQNNFVSWNSNAFTGFATKIENNKSCTGTGNSEQCYYGSAEIDAYEILFLESYARFVECNLTQDLYVSPEELQEKYGDDDYKQNNPDGNAQAEHTSFYGGSPNHKEPKFFNSSGNSVPLRIFDPFFDDNQNKDKNPFAQLKEGDKVVAVFNEKLKKYIIVAATNKTTNKVIKFALVSNKKSSDKTATAVMVDDLGRPIDSAGELLTNANFQQNFITVQDPYLNRGADIYGTSMSYASGPAIGSINFNEHIEGISDLEYNGKKFGPFIGFAVEIAEPSGSSQGSGSNNNKYEIITLERFAQYVTGVIGVKQPENEYYYGAMTSYWDGRHPLSKSTKDFTRGLNLKLKYNITPMNGEHSFIMGDFKEGQSASPSETFQALASKIDGCKFIAKLSDTESFNSAEDLVYHIVESEHVALFGSSVIKKQEVANELNVGDQASEDDTNEKIQSNYTNGFQWSRQESKANYNSIRINNRNDWIGKGYLVQNSNIYTKLQELSEQGPIYRILEAGTIAEVAEKKASDGKWGMGQSSGEDSYEGDEFYQGVDPSSIGDNDGGPPQLDPLAFGTPWMAYEDSPAISLWDERDGGVAGAKNYRVVYVREAAIIITGKCAATFKPTNQDNIQVSISQNPYASCPKADRSPIPTLLTKVKNPMGYGAREGDYVTLQRVFSETLQEDLANYYYIVIGTGGGKPETC